MQRESRSKVTKLGILASLLFTALLSLSSIPNVEGLVPALAAPVQVATDAAAAADPFGQTSASPWGCFMGGNWFVFYRSSATVIKYVYSSDTITWKPSTILITLSNTPGNSGGQPFEAVTCSPSSTFVLVVYSSSTNLNPGSQNMFWNTISLTNPASPVVNYGSDQLVSGEPACVNCFAQNVGASVDTSGNVIMTSTNAAGTNAWVYLNGAYQFAYGSLVASATLTTSMNNYKIVMTSTVGNPANFCSLYYFGTTYTTASASRVMCGNGSTVTRGGVQHLIYPFESGAGNTGNPCSVEDFDTQLRTFTNTVPSGLSTVGCGFNTLSTNMYSASDGASNVWLVYAGAGVTGTATQFVYSQDGGNTYSNAVTFNSNYGSTTVTIWAMTSIATNSFGATQSLLIGTDAAGNIYVQVLGSTVASAPTQTQTIGQCPTKNTATFTMVNSTLYFYYGTSVGQSSVNTIQVGISSVGGSTGTHSLGFYIYAASTAGSITASNPLNQVYGVIKAFTSGTTHNVYTLQVAAPLIASGVTWGVAIVGDNKIAINQSSLSGMYTVAGAASTAAQAASFTSQGSSVGTELYLCATAQYSSSVTTTLTSTVTTTTTTTTGTAAGASVFLGNANLPITILFLVGPALFFAAVTRNIVGMVLGLATGALILVIVGAVDRYLFAALIVGLIAIAFIARSRDN